MMAESQSSHEKVGVLLTRVRADFLRASRVDERSKGAVIAAQALRRAFELLNYDRGCSATCPSSLEVDDGGIEEEGGGRQRRRRRAFLESSYFQFASFLLREVGPAWLPVWDDIVNNNANKANIDDTSSPPNATTAGDTHVSAACPLDMNRDDLGGIRDVFGAFFGPPAVPSGLALLALCEALGKRPSTAAAVSESSSSSGHQDPWAASIAGGDDARTVQIVCRLLEPYLRDQTSLLLMSEELIPKVDCSSGGTALTTPESTRRTGELEKDRELCEEAKQAMSTQNSKQYAREDAACCGGSLLVQAVMDLARSYPSVGCGPEQQQPDDGDELFLGIGEDAAGRLASSLCLAPQRVANSLGPLAPPGLAPPAFFSTVCRAVVCATVSCLQTPTTTAPARHTALRRRGGDGAGLAGKDGIAAGDDGGTPSAGGGSDPEEEEEEEDKFGKRTRSKGRRCSGIIGAANTGNVWMTLSRRLLTAGRASDLADAWLEAIVAAKEHEDIGQETEKGPMQCTGLPPTATAAGRTAPVSGDRGDAGGGSSYSSGSLDFVGDGKDGAPAANARNESNAAVEAAWQTWAEGEAGPEVHAWMMTRVPASRRKDLVEAILRALFKKHRSTPKSRGGRRQPSAAGKNGTLCWQPGFPLAACKALIGWPLLFVKSGGASQDRVGEKGEVMAYLGEGEGNVFSVGFIEELLLQRPLPLPAAEAIAETLAWCDRFATETAGEGGGGDEGSGNGGVGSGGEREQVVMGAMKRVAAVWAEPSFLNRSPPRQQEFYTLFLLAVLRR